MRSSIALFAAVLVHLATQSASAQMRITEWMYDAHSPEAEFVELTNIGASDIDMTGWSFDDSNRGAGAFSLSAFGSVAAGESVLISENPAADFRTVWGLSAATKVIGDLGHPNGHNLGRSDELNVYDAASSLVDRLTFNDQGTGTVKGPRTQFFSGNPSTPAALGANNASLWVLSAVGDSFGSHASATPPPNANVGNPGVFAVPEPSTALLMILGAGFMLNRLGRRKHSV